MLQKFCYLRDEIIKKLVVDTLVKKSKKREAEAAFPLQTLRVTAAAIFLLWFDSYCSFGEIVHMLRFIRTEILHIRHHRRQWAIMGDK